MVSVRCCVCSSQMVLSACSPYFQVLFTNTPDDKHPILILKDITLADMKSLLDFMYRGEVSVDQERLTAFLRVAESLRIKGLTEVSDDKPSSTAAASGTASNSATARSSAADTAASASTTATAKQTAASTASSNNNNNGLNHLQQLQQQQQQQHNPPQLHRIQPYVMQQQRKAHGMMLTNPLLGNALTQPKRKRGRPRKLSGSSGGAGPNAAGAANAAAETGEFDGSSFDASEHLVQVHEQNYQLIVSPN